MKKVVEFLQKNPVQYLATVGRDGKAKCRPFMFCFEQDGKLWFCTNNTKDVYKDMLENPEIEVSVSSPEYAWIRLHGKAVFENNMSVKEGCMNNPIVKGQYQTADNPIFEVFYLENPHGVIADFSGIRLMNSKMTKTDYLKLLVDEIHSTTVATIGADGHPQTRIIDMMYYDKEGIYFLTAKGKEFDAQLMEQQYVAISATKEKIAISLRGKVQNIGKKNLDIMFEKNPYMKEIYPGVTREVLEVFRL